MILGTTRMKNFILTISILIVFTCCSTYIKNPKNLDLKPLTGKIKEPIEGNFKNLKGNASLWSQIKKWQKDSKRSNNSGDETVELTILSSEIIKLRLKKNEFVKDSLYISGNFIDNAFTFDTRRKIEDIFPLFWTFDKTRFSLKLDSANNLVLSRCGWSINFLFVAPIMAADGCLDFTYMNMNRLE